METKQDYLTTYHIERAGHFGKACESMIQFVKTNDLKKEQIISVSCNESIVEEGEALLILFYKKDQEPTMTSLEELQYHIIRNIDDWDSQHEEVLKKVAHKSEVVALTHTAKNIGQINVQIVWYLPSTESHALRYKRLESTKDWPSLI
jgi:hypothetical protein